MNTIKEETSSLIKHRLFLVGCPRSGTSLLQSIISSHEKVLSFPESKLYLTLTTPGSKRSRLNLASTNSRKTFSNFLETIGAPSKIYLLPKHALFISQHAYAIRHAFDQLAIESRKTVWLEKTPQHLYRIECIEEFVPQPKFIHIIRDGRDVIASLYEVTSKYPEVWGGKKNINQCIDEYISSINESRKYLNRDNHVFISYEDLVLAQISVIRKIESFLGMSFDPERIANRAKYSNSIVRKHETWKKDVFKEIENKSLLKFNSIFDISERDYITQRLKDANVLNAPLIAV